MLLCKFRDPLGTVRFGTLEGESVRPFSVSANMATLADVLHSPAPLALAQQLAAASAAVPLASVTLVAPIDQQEVWAAGVTYKRSQVARMQESESGASHYDKVYTAPRPEIFFKATPARVSGPHQPLRVRSDSKWSVPEPELALILNPTGTIVGYTVGNDMSARDIEGENPLYLPQAKVYNQCCGLGPAILLAEQPLSRQSTTIALRIERNGQLMFEGSALLDQMKRELPELADWLTRENHLPTGGVLLTGTGIVPPDQFTLINGDVVHITISGIGTLTNPIVQS